jgi:hypothetical protein
MDSLITAAARALAAGDPLGALKRVALRDDGSVQKVLSEPSKTLPQAILERLLGILNWAGIASLATFRARSRRSNEPAKRVKRQPDREAKRALCGISTIGRLMVGLITITSYIRCYSSSALTGSCR